MAIGRWYLILDIGVLINFQINSGHALTQMHDLAHLIGLLTILGSEQRDIKEICVMPAMMTTLEAWTMSASNDLILPRISQFYDFPCF